MAAEKNILNKAVKMMDLYVDQKIHGNYKSDMLTACTFDKSYKHFCFSKEGLKRPQRNKIFEQRLRGCYYRQQSTRIIRSHYR